MICRQRRQILKPGVQRSENLGALKKGICSLKGSGKRASVCNLLRHSLRSLNLDLLYTRRIDIQKEIILKIIIGVR